MSYTDTQTKLAGLLMGLQGTETLERVKIYVGRFSGGRSLTDYLGDASVTLSDKETMCESLLTILQNQDWSRLPELVANSIAETLQGQNPPALASEQPRTFTESEIRSLIRQELGGVLARIATVLKQS